jgi:O-antigen/teichoic acid export membrane protein
LSPSSGILITAFAGMICGFVMYYSLAVYGKNEQPAVSIRKTIVENWIFGRWLLVSAVFIGAASQFPTILSGFLLGTGEAGALRALQTLIQPMMLSITTLSTLATPVLSLDFSTGNWINFRNKSFALIAILMVMAIVFETVLLFFHTPIESYLYEGKFEHYSRLLPLLGIVPIILSLTSGMQVCFQAAQKPAAILWSSLVWAIVSLGTGFLLARQAGLWGVAWSILIGYVVFGITLMILYRQWILLPVSRKRSLT